MYEWYLNGTSTHGLGLSRLPYSTLIRISSILIKNVGTWKPENERHIGEIFG